MKFAVNWFHNVNLALYSNRIMPDRCLVHGCSNRSDMNAGVCIRKCIRNWPLPIGAFQDQCKLIVINEHNLGKNPNWREADQLAIYKRRREVHHEK